ncbi:MAG TPA: glycosyltransferase family A protein [Blastocatellia bacterium]|jgi:glycosyltransferase involved in cell wall biosynthesis
MVSSMNMQETRFGKTESGPAVSIIIPVYNAARFIGEALDSVFAQTFTDFEAIVVNDGSSDKKELELAIEPYRERIVYIEQENRGVSAARNSGIRAARGRYIALLDSDDIWEPEYLAVQVEALEREPGLDVVFPNALIFGDSPHAGKKYQDVNPAEGDVTFERLVTQKCYVWVGVTARREVIVNAGMFDESLRSVEDFDLWLRIVKRGGRIGYHRRVLARYRKRVGSLSADPAWMFQNIFRVLEKARQTLDLTASELRVLERGMARFRATKRLYDGKKALFRGDAKEAGVALSEANLFFKSLKINLVLLSLRFAPWLILRAYDIRDRFVPRASTRV